ncbi:hypothetical protein ACLMAJ_29020 [Nocardia sp. KC 131]|uniref:hypothetical protein n=1 Tax=Nocardia arseniciresistens TaxID=3392119 RepID=UPI00398EC47A
MTDIKDIFPAGSDVDRAEQNTLARDSDRDLGLDTTGLHPLAERIRTAFDSAEITDRIDQAWITPLDCDADGDDDRDSRTR